MVFLEQTDVTCPPGQSIQIKTIISTIISAFKTIGKKSIKNCIHWFIFSVKAFQKNYLPLQTVKQIVLCHLGTGLSAHMTETGFGSWNYHITSKRAMIFECKWWISFGWGDVISHMLVFIYVSYAYNTPPFPIYMKHTVIYASATAENQ